LVSFTEDNRKLAHAAKMEVEIEDKRRQQRSMRLAAEERMAKLIDEAEEKAMDDELVVSQNRELATELQRQRGERERKEREIQRICEESEELKDLERRLKLAYMNKERAAQHEEKVVLTRMDREQNLAIEDAMEVDRQLMVAAEIEKERARRMVGLEQKSVLQVQIREREELLEQAKLEAVKDKAMVDEIVAKIEAEDQRDWQIKERRKAETRAIIKAYEEQRRNEVAEKKRSEAAAEAEIKKHLDYLASRNAGVAEARAAKEANQAAAFAAIAAEAERLRLEEEEMGRLRDLLWEEELEAARRAADAAKAESRARSKAEMALANQQMLAAKARKKELEAEEEARLVGLMMDKFAKDEAEEAAGAARRAANRAQYQTEINAQKALRHEMYEKERIAELEGVADTKAEEDYRRAVVNEARRRLLEEHAKRLHGFLPKGALANQDEAALFRTAAGYQATAADGASQTFGSTFRPGATQGEEARY